MARVTTPKRKTAKRSVKTLTVLTDLDARVTALEAKMGVWEGQIRTEPSPIEGDLKNINT